MRLVLGLALIVAACLLVSCAWLQWLGAVSEAALLGAGLAALVLFSYGIQFTLDSSAEDE